MKEKYLYHVTVTTGHARKSPRTEVSDDTINILKTWISDMLKGDLRGIVDSHYSCRAGQYNAKMIEFIISRLSDDFKQVDLVRFVVCNHSRRKNVAWALVDGKGDAPDVPFCAVQLLDNFILQDLEHLSFFGDFERCISWAWLDMQNDKKAV
ncbi:lactate dehydrogenase [Aggregatibacter actinomycetemcomitans]|uniref:lactate dehydrogenase n=1 Tax=Aggregatibacter actinomycetemcomitans TaxID=714 RepID=UPI0011D38AC6|nr:lactate dehydrogenase [Aggregatibacter actinomycetemcomitans]TYB18508.1 lactate dehydrogenase [Aggregatibacter actinomycetemcomitans]